MKRYFKIEIYSCGRETVMGVISKDQFDYWSNKEQENNGAIGEYFSQFESDPENTNKNIPEKSRFNCSWFELDNVIHTHGPEITDDNFLKIVETDKDKNEINSEEFKMDEDLLSIEFTLSFEEYGPSHDKVKGKYFFLGQTFEKGVWDTNESGMGLIETDEKGLNKKKLNFHVKDIYGESSVSGVSYNDKQYDLIGNTRTNSSSMNVYKGNS